MIVDTSALVAILTRENDREWLVRKLSEAPVRKISVASVLEVGIVMIAKELDDVERKIDAFLHEAEIEVIAFDKNQAMLAIDASRKYGRTRHPAKLNFGDCMTYALAKQTGEPLLFIGNDFGQTDLLIA